MATTSCETPDLFFPLMADLYFPILAQGSYGEIKKDWVFDRSIAIAAQPYSRKGAGDISPQVFLQYNDILIARTKNDLRTSTRETEEALTNVLITNIRNSSNVIIYQESAGPRKGKGTIYEIASYQPHQEPYGDIGHYSMVIRRSENQAST